ncbi:P-loop containing nucleoside triphosphate hydrolase protein, partial [Tribonema minus]
AGQTRCLPNVVFFGVSKAGTTSLAHWLSQHPQVKFMGGRPSESRAYLKGRTLADIRERSKRLAPSADPVSDVVVDYTPHYAMVPEVPYRICHLLDCSSTKFIVLLREPAERAISSWRFKERYKLKRDPEAYISALNAMRAGQPTASHHHAPELLTKSMERGMAKAAEWLACVEVEVAAAAAAGRNVTADAIDLQLCNAVRLFEGQAAYEVPSDGSLSLRDHVGKPERSGPDSAKWQANYHLSLEYWDSVLSKRYNPTRRIPELEDQVTSYDRGALRRFYAPLNAALDDLLMMDTGYFTATGS